MSTTNIELTTIEAATESQNNLVPERKQPSSNRLPPADEGKDAWLFLAACFVIEALVWGFPFSYGKS